MILTNKAKQDFEKWLETEKAWSLIHLEEIPVNHFVADITVHEDGELKLIELNPFGLSDPCLFESYKNLHGTFKYNK